MSLECDKSYSTPTSQSFEYTSSSLLGSPKDDVYEHMKTRFYTFIVNKIPFGRYDFDKIHYYPFYNIINSNL